MRALLIGAVEGTRVAFDALLASPDWRIVAVMTLPPSLASRHSDFVDLAAIAAAAEIPVMAVANCNAPDVVEQVRAMAPDLVFVIGWSQICGPALRAAVADRIIGYHPAALPRLRGRAVIPWTILLDEKITASTLFQVAEGVDSGPIIAQQFFHVAPRETAGTLYAKHMHALRQMLEACLADLAAKPMQGVQQDDTLATWAARRCPTDGEIDWRQPVHAIDRLIRAVGRPYPGAYTQDGDSRLVIWAAEPAADGERYHARPGQVIARDEGALLVTCGDGGALKVTDFAGDGGKVPALHALLGRSR